MFGGNNGNKSAFEQVTGAFAKIQVVIAVLLPILPVILFCGVIVIILVMILGQTQGMEGIANAGDNGCERAIESKWAQFFNSEEEGTSFYNKINDMIEDNPGVDINLVSAILTFETNVSVEEDYKCNVGEVDPETGEVIKEECTETSETANRDTKELYQEAKEIVNGVKDKSEDEIKDWLQNTYVEDRLTELGKDLPDDPENKAAVIEQKVDDIFSIRDIYAAMVCKDEDTTSSVTSCTYQVNGKTVQDVKVEVLSCDGSEVEFTVDFEKYVKGVVFAENRGAPDEAIKAQAVAARSFALTRQNAMCPGNPENCNYGYDPKRNVIRLRGCENDQVYCDPDQGCTIEETNNLDYGTVHVWKQGNTGKGRYIAPFTGQAKKHFDQLIDSVSGQVVVDKSGNVVYTNFASNDQNAWSAKADLGKKYDQILLEHYKKNGATSLATTCASTGEVLPGIKFPIAEKFYSPNCYSAGEYYQGGTYHGSIDFSHTALFGNRLELSAPVKIVSSTNGTIVGIGTDKANTYPSCFQGGVMGGQGYYIRIDDPKSEYNGYTLSYWHLDTLNPKLKVGDKVKTGDYLGTMGNTGCSSGKHLHWQLQSPSGKNIIMDKDVQKYCQQNYTKG